MYSSTSLLITHAGTALCLAFSNGQSHHSRANEHTYSAGALTRTVAHLHTMNGTVRDSASHAPLAGAHVELVGTRFATVTRADGSFALTGIPDGEYQLRVTQLGYRPFVHPSVHVADDGTPSLEVTLAPLPQSLREVVVTPGYYGVLASAGASTQSMTRAQIAAVPQLGEDIYRAVTHLPGIAASEYSAGFAVHGFGPDELYVTFDGLELVEPYHLKDIRGGALSILDADVIGNAELTTAGYSAEYGDRLGGVFTMRSVDPRRDRTRTTVGLSVMNARASSQGGFAGGKGALLVSGRRGYLDFALRATGSTDSLNPRYSDLFAKVMYDVPKFGRVSAHVLHAGDNMVYRDAGDGSLLSSYGSSYGWLTLDSPTESRLRQHTVASIGRLTWRRSADELDQAGNGQTVLAAQISDARALDILGLRQDWSYESDGRSLFKWGFELRHEASDLEYLRWMRHTRINSSGQREVYRDSIDVAVAPSGTRAALYVADRFRLTNNVALELGLRHDRTTIADDQATSPRVNLLWQARAGTSIRAAWGKYVQAHALQSLQVQDGELSPSRSERSEQRVLGLDQTLPGGVSVRAEGYDELVKPRRARWTNVSGRIELLPENSWDRVLINSESGRSRGIELLLARNGGGRMDWTASYALASTTDRIDGRDVPRNTDQRHTINFLWSYHPVSNRWRLSLTSLWHSGQPFTVQQLRIDTIINTPQQLQLQTTPYAGELNTGRLPSYERVDVRWTRYFDARGSRITVFAEVFNLFNNKNVGSYDTNLDVDSQRRITTSSNQRTMLPRLPTLGFTWEF